MIRALFGLRDGANDLMDDTLEEVGYKILKEAKTRTPVDTGFLRSSGEVERKRDHVAIRFTAKYALPVHERVEVPHSPGEAKFLENAFEVVLSKEEASEILLRRLLDEAGKLGL